SAGRFPNDVLRNFSDRIRGVCSARAMSRSDTLVRHGSMYSSGRSRLQMQRTAEYRRPCRTGVSDPPGDALNLMQIVAQTTAPGTATTHPAPGTVEPPSWITWAPFIALAAIMFVFMSRSG